MAGIFSTCFNSLVLYVFFKNKNLQGVTHILAVMLSAGDILSAFCLVNSVFIQSYVAYSVKNVYTNLFCHSLQVENFMTVILMAVSITIIFGITYERYIAVLRTILYKINRNSTFKEMGTILVIFTTGSILTLSQTFAKVGRPILFLTIISTILICFYGYVRIFLKLRISGRAANFENLPNIARQKKSFITSPCIPCGLLPCHCYGFSD